jgi:hypothetical protein
MVKYVWTFLVDILLNVARDWRAVVFSIVVAGALMGFAVALGW